MGWLDALNGALIIMYGHFYKLNGLLIYLRVD